MNYVQKMMRDEQKRKEKARKQELRKQTARIDRLLKQAGALLIKQKASDGREGAA